MIDRELLRTNPDSLKQTLEKRFQPAGLIDELVNLDAAARRLKMETEQLQAESNSLSKTKESAFANRAKLQDLKAKLVALRPELEAAETALLAALGRVPNILLADVPVGSDASANQVLTKHGEIKLHSGQPHDELLERLGWADLATAARVSGARFHYLKGEAALAQWRLMSAAITLAVSKGFQFVLPPTMVREELLAQTGFFPLGQDDTFATADGRYLVGTSEPMLLALANQKLTDLPQRFVGFSTCFRREAGSYGRDVKGLFRLHQFDKVELVSIVNPADSEKEHQFLVSLQEEFVQNLELPYQTVLLSSGDQSHIAAKQIDLETWFPAQERYRETHSASNCWDYQARGLGLKVDGVFAHTLNATLATERLLLAVVENGQQPDGTVEWPALLRPN